jgi:hypothetical protein
MVAPVRQRPHTTRTGAFVARRLCDPDSDTGSTTGSDVDTVLDAARGGEGRDGT